MTLWKLFSILAVFGATCSASIVGTFFDYRKVNLTISDCDICEIFPETSYPNLGFFLSIEPIWTFFTKHEKQDLITSYVSSFGFPSNVHCYFHKDAQYNLEIDWKGFLDGEGGSVSIGSGYFCIGFVLENLIEFLDVDQDGTYNPKVDELLTDISFLKAKWRKAEVRSGDYQSIETTSHEELIKIKWSTSPMIIKLSDMDHILTPNGTLMDIQINKFPFTRPDSKLAIKGYVAVDGTDETQFYERTDDDRSVIQIGDRNNRGYFSWSNKGKVSFVSASGKPIVRPKREDPTSNPDAASGLVKAILGTSAQIQNLIITFQGEQSESMSWNSACGYGEPPKINKFADMLVAGILFSLLLVPAVLGTVFYRYWMKKVQSSEETTPFARPMNS